VKNESKNKTTKQQRAETAKPSPVEHIHETMQNALALLPLQEITSTGRIIDVVVVMVAIVSIASNSKNISLSTSAIYRKGRGK
jgi:hypothetical protein